MNKADKLIGLAQKAGKIISGSSMAEDAVRYGTASLVIIARDASANTIKRMKDKTAYYEVPMIAYSDKAGLGHMIGKEERSVIVLTDQGFAESIRKQIESEYTEPKQ